MYLKTIHKYLLKFFFLSKLFRVGTLIFNLLPATIHIHVKIKKDPHIIVKAILSSHQSEIMQISNYKKADEKQEFKYELIKLTYTK